MEEKEMQKNIEKELLEMIEEDMLKSISHVRAFSFIINN